MNMTESILTETESMFDRQWRNMEFCYEIMQQHREMEQFVNECLIKSTGNKKAINEMYILNESAAGDKIKGFFTKIKNFFKKIFDKLGASLSALFTEQKKYIDKYANIITKCKWQQGEITDVKDRFKGLPRIFDAVDNVELAIFGLNLDKIAKGDTVDESLLDMSVFASADSISKAEVKKKIEPGSSREQAFKEYSEGTYWSKVDNFSSYKETDSNGVVDANATFSAWFDGSKDPVTWSSDEVEDNFQTIINTAYAGQSYIVKLEKIVSAVNKKMDDVSKMMEDYYKTQQDKIMQAVKGNGKTQEEVDRAKEEEKKAAEAVQNAKTESAIINELSATGGTTPKPEEVKMSSKTGNKESQAATDAVKKINNADISKDKFTAKDAVNTSGVDDSNKDSVEKKAQEILDVDIYNRQILLNDEINISSTIVRKMFDSFKNTNSDFFKIIQIHVQWYLSNPGEEQKSENQSTKSRNLNMNAGSEQVGKAPTNTPNQTQQQTTNTPNQTQQQTTNTPNQTQQNKTFGEKVKETFSRKK